MDKPTLPPTHSLPSADFTYNDPDSPLKGRYYHEGRVSEYARAYGALCYAAALEAAASKFPNDSEYYRNVAPAIRALQVKP